ncbi:hypothetical protein QJS10_CPB17g02464 [Acorus calamus]|uniref:Uncharacterized protein n=1 Tax=Acorus calamus TaxID=4465 RepID=A0AAV9CYD2_ACOCL|nr:hypothetical protein QJS10_CPB17g02464 [Acorus calamus]
MAVPTYYAPPMDFNGFSYITSGVTRSGTTSSSMQTASSGSSGRALLQSHAVDVWSEIAYIYGSHNFDSMDKLVEGYMDSLCRFDA